MTVENAQNNTATKKSEWNLLYKLGGIASILAALLFLFQLIFIRWSYYPKNIADWYMMFQRSRILGLFYLNTLDIITVSLLGIMFVAVCARLRPNSKSTTTLALPFAFLGIGMFIIPRTMMLPLVRLSSEYASAAQGVSADILLSAGKMIAGLCMPTIQTTGFFFVSIAAFMLSLVMINSNRLSKLAGFVGIMAFLLLIAENVCIIAAPALVGAMMVVAGVFWAVWWILVGAGLLMVKD